MFYITLIMVVLAIVILLVIFAIAITYTFIKRFNNLEERIKELEKQIKK